MILDAKAKVVYFNSSNEIFQNTPLVKSASYTPAYGNAAGPIDGFEFEDVPADIVANQSVTLKITAYDNNKQPVTNTQVKCVLYRWFKFDFCECA